MNRFSNGIVKRVNAYTQRLLEHDLSSKHEKVLAQGARYDLVDASEVGTCIATIKESTIESVQPMPIYGILKSGELQLHSPALHCYRFEHASIMPFSDYIMFPNHTAVWVKRDLPIFTKDVPMDVGLLSYDTSSVIVKSSPKIVKLSKVFSMCGVYSNVWSHFMIQYVCKLYSLMRLPKKIREGLTILVPEYKDGHVACVFDSFVSSYLPEVSVRILKGDEVACCDELYVIESTTAMIDNEKYVSYVDMVIPQYVSGLLKKYMVPQFPIVQPFERIFLVRRGEWRNLLNSEEVEAFFASLGFRMVEPHKLSYHEKVSLFHSAKEVVGPYSSGFSNTIYCQPGTKVLILSNLQRSFEPFLTFYRQYFGLDLLCVTGTDEQQENSHSPYKIPLERVKAAYYELSNKKI